MRKKTKRCVAIISLLCILIVTCIVAVVVCTLQLKSASRQNGVEEGIRSTCNEQNICARKGVFLNKKIALCFMVYDNINNETIWHDYLSHVDSSLYSMYIHYKHNAPSRHFDQYKLSDCIDTCWGCLSVVKAQMLLIKEGLKDVLSTHFVILTQACLPFKSFRHISACLDPDKSYFNMAPDEQVFPRCQPALRYLPRHTLKKAGMGAILNRKHAELLLKYEHEIDLWFKDVANADEHAIISLLFYLGLQEELVTTDNHAVDCIIMSQWPDQPGFQEFDDSVVEPAKLPITYNHLCEEELHHLINSRCLFGRKFSPGCSGLENLVELLD